MLLHSRRLYACVPFINWRMSSATVSHNLVCTYCQLGDVLFQCRFWSLIPLVIPGYHGLSLPPIFLLQSITPQSSRPMRRQRLELKTDNIWHSNSAHYSWYNTFGRKGWGMGIYLRKRGLRILGKLIHDIQILRCTMDKLTRYQAQLWQTRRPQL